MRMHQCILSTPSQRDSQLYQWVSGTSSFSNAPPNLPVVVVDGISEDLSIHRTPKEGGLGVLEGWEWLSIARIVAWVAEGFAKGGVGYRC